MEGWPKFMGHPSFNVGYYDDMLKYIVTEARDYGLVWEVTETFNNLLASRFQGDDYPISHDQYFEEANSALFEWDI